MYRRPRTQPQLGLPLERPSQPNEQLRNAFKDADLDRVGIDFSKVLLHHRAAKLLANMASAKQRGLFVTAQRYARQIMNLKGELK